MDSKKTEIKGFIIDMDCFIYHGELLPRVKRFVDWLRLKRKFYVLTNSSQRAKS